MTPKEILLEQLAACSAQNGWFVCMGSALRGLSAVDASLSPGGEAHSVWQVLNHVVFWNERYLMRFRDEGLSKVNDNAATFQGETGADEEAWRLIRERFDSVMGEWVKAITGAEDAKLAGPVQNEPGTSWHSAIANMAIHTAHHIGQIVTLRKIQGTWSTAQGVS